MGPNRHYCSLGGKHPAPTEPRVGGPRCPGHGSYVRLCRYSPKGSGAGTSGCRLRRGLEVERVKGIPAATASEMATPGATGARGETGHGRQGDNGGRSARRPRPPQPGTAKSAASSGRAPPTTPLSRPPPPPHRVAGAVSFLGRDPCPVRTGPLHAPRLHDPPLRPCPGPRRRSPLLARPPRTHLPRRAPGRQWGRDGTHLSGRSGGRGRPSLGGRGRAPARAPHLPLPAARAERARLGRERSGLGCTAPPPTAPSGGQSRHRGGAADSVVAP